MIPDLGAALEDAADLIREAGVTVVTDERHVRPPCVLLVLDALRTRRLDGSTLTAALTLWLVVGDHGRTAALAQLSPMLSAVSAVLPPEGDVETATLAVEQNAALPALRYPITVTITKE